VTQLPLPARPYLAPIWNELDGVVRMFRPRGERPPVAAEEGDGTPVLLLPGFLAGDGALAPLAARLVADGHRPWGARMGRNLACSESAMARLLDELEHAVARHGRHVLVGHSRGGLLARVMAHRRPELVAGVVTLGSPHRDQLAIHPVLWAQALALAAAGTLGVPGLLHVGCAIGSCCATFRRDLTAPLDAAVGRLAIYSRADGVVDWRACLDGEGHHVEVHASHCGMTTNAAALHLVSRAVARFGAHRPRQMTCSGAGKRHGSAT